VLERRKKKKEGRNWIFISIVLLSPALIGRKLERKEEARNFGDLN